MAKELMDDDGHDNEMRKVKLPSDAPFEVYFTEEEYFTERVRRYLEDNHFTNVSDLQDLDRVIIGELLIFRWGTWLMSQKNYWGEGISDSELNKGIKELSSELRLVKASLNLDKTSRDKQRGEDSVAVYLENLGIRAEHHQYKRNEELYEALSIFHDLAALVTMYDNCDEDERRQQKITPETIFAHLRETAFPRMAEIDRKFRQDGDLAQKLWIKDQ